MRWREEGAASPALCSVIHEDRSPRWPLLFAFFFRGFSIFDKTSKQARGMNGHLEGFKHIITSVIVHE